MKPPNKEAQASAEVVEGRARTKENIGQSHTPPAQDGYGVSQGLAGVRKAAKERKQERFTALLHHLTTGPAAAKLLRSEAERGAGSGRGEVAGV